ncbi:MAG TPA: DUF202 domain-containing protein [Acidimicrobiia bacterium]|nr:DUF202 domain-containing protein [Acidimicrobiia bacterium]
MTFDPTLHDEVDKGSPGLYAERTQLAWTRSGIALLAALAILIRHIWREGPDGSDAVAIALLAVAALGWGIGILGWRFVHQRNDNVDPRRPEELLAVSAGTVAVALAGIVVSFA